VPRVSAEERAKRDSLVARLLLAGHSYREIGRNPRVRLSVRGVQLAVKRALKVDSDFKLLSEYAREVNILRCESLLRIAFPRALAGDLRAWEACRRLLAQEAKLFGLYDGPPEDDGEVEPQPVG
jgi:hypothetical protein